MTRFGDPSVLELAELPTPTPGPGEVLLRIEAAGINRLDHRIREGRVNPDLAFPHVLGSDAVGVVEALGEGVRAPEVGARVIPMPGYPADPADPGADVLSASRSYAIRGLAENGAYAQYMTVPARWTAREDTGRVAVELATLPTPLVAAVRALRGVGEVRAGRKVLIHAGASGTGAVMVQVAKALGAEVAITARTEARRAFARGLGADLAIDPSEDVVGLVRDWSGGGADVVVDTLGRDMLALSLEATRPLGVV
ncbi:MAG: zinc-binding alcohol dehydrogenase family protein, partial [Pseudomonadota bacterium]